MVEEKEMNVLIEDKGNSKFKLTVTADNEVRIKIMSGVSTENQRKIQDKLCSVASKIIGSGLNVNTMRGTCKLNSLHINMFYGKNKEAGSFTLKEE
jgi:hypothetical protein